MHNRLLYDYHAEKNRKSEGRGVKLFILAQFVNYGIVFFLVLGGLILFLLALKAIL